MNSYASLRVRIATICVVVFVNVEHGFGAPPADDLADAVRWLDDQARELIRASRRPMQDGTIAFPPQAGPGYEAFWLRDYAYMLEGCPDALTDQELRAACRLFAAACRRDGAAVDCIKFDGTPIYRPGFDTMGEHPVADGAMFLVDVVWHSHRRLNDKQLLADVMECLLRAMAAVPRNPKNGLVHISPAGYDRCPYGFTDTVRKQGDELFCSLLLVQADRQLVELLAALDREAESKTFAADADRVAAAIRATFWDETLGLFRAATLKCREPDLWGSAFAVALHVATNDQSVRIAAYFQNHYAEIIQSGQLRHLPGGTYWEEASARDVYQNGGFWAVPVGWFITALDLVDPPLAEKTLVDLVQDFQRRGIHEWVRGNDSAVENYLASATMPLAGAKQLLEQRARPNR